MPLASTNCVGTVTAVLVLTVRSSFVAMDDVNQLGCAVRCPQNEQFENGRRCNTKACTIHPLIRPTNEPAATASVTTARAALAQSMSFCTVGAPLSPIAPTTSPSNLMGNPPPHAAIRASVGMPANSDGSPWIKSKNSCVETPNKAVYALFCAISMVGIGAPSIRLKALRFPPSSRIATFSLTPISLAFATAASTIFCASSEEMLCFFTTLAIGLPPLLDLYCVWIIPALRACVGSGNHSAIHRKIRPGNVRGLRTGDNRHQRSDLINAPVTVECCECLLRYRPFARGGIRIRVNRTRLDIVDCDAPASHLSGQPLSEHLDRSLCGRVGHKAGRQGTLTHGRADHDDAAAALHVLQRRLRH